MNDAARYRKPRELLSLGRGHAIVEASAGTGKTYLLEHLVVDLLLTADVALDQLLVVTFTEKATTELTHRIRRKIQELLELTPDSPLARAAAGAPDEECWTLDEPARDRLRRALYGFDRASILTIHAFCQRILTENAFLQGRLFDEEAVEETEAFHAALIDTLRRDIAARPTGALLLEAWRRAGQDLPRLEKILGAAHKKLASIYPRRDDTLRPTARFDPALLEQAFAVWTTMARDTSAEALAAGLQKNKVHPNTARALPKRIAEISAAIGEGRSGPAAALAALERFDRAQKRKDGFFRYLHTITAPKGVGDPLIDRLRAAALVMDAAVPALSALMTGEILPLVAERLARRKREAGLFDFQDMLTLVAQSLEGDVPRATDLIATMRARYRYALVDEFQDTDEIQWRIFRRIFFERPSDDRSALTLVGDPKQAIYGFRGADVHAYLRARAEVETEQPRVRLSQSFRATRVLIDAQNALLDDGDPHPFFRNDGPIRYSPPVSCGRPELALVDGRGEEAAPVVVLDIDRDPAFQGPRLRFWEIKPALLGGICREIAALLGLGLGGAAADAGRRLFLVPDVNHDRPREPLRPGQIFVLTRTAREAREIGGALRGARIPFAYYRQEKLFDTVEAREVLDVLRALADPDDRTARYRAFITAFFGLTLPDLAACDDLPADHPLLTRLADWRALADAGQLEHLFARIVDDSGIVRRELFERDSERGLTNYLHLFELLLEEAARSRCTIRELCQRLASYINGTRRPPGREGDLQRLETDTDTVQVMTVHQSKGLEAAVVFLYGATWPGPRGEVRTFHDQTGARAVRVGRQPESEEPLYENEQADEERRVLYVALTRAQGRLYLPRYPLKPLCDLRGDYKHVNERLHALLGGITLPEVRRLFETRTITAPAAAPLPLGSAEAGTLAMAIEGWSPPGALLADVGEAPTDSLFRDAPQRRAGFLVTSYSAVKRLHGGFNPAAATAMVATAMTADAPGADDEAEGDVLRADALPARPPVSAEPSAEPAPAEVPRDELPRGRLSGRFLHDVIEHLPLETLAARPPFDDWQRLPEIRLLFERMARRHDRRPAHIPHAQRLIHTALTAPIRARDTGGVVTLPGGLAADALHPRREVEFLFPIPEPDHPLLARDGGGDGDAPAWRIERGVVKGYIDLLFEHDGRFYVCDWKGDWLPDWQAATVAAHCRDNYTVQAQLYTLATLRLVGVGAGVGSARDDYDRRFGGVLYCFLRGMRQGSDGTTGIFFQRPSFAEVAAWERAMLEPGYWGRV